MAKIALVTKSLGPHTLTLANSLSHLRHELILITSQGQTPSHEWQGPTLMPFQRWNSWEALRLFPHLLGHNPEVLHFIFDQQDDNPTSAHWMLGKLWRTLPRKVVAGSFYHSPLKLSRWRMRFFLEQCHLVTWASRGHMLHAKRNFSKNQRTLTEVLPPLENNDLSHGPVPPELERLTEALKFFVVLPGDPDPFFEKYEMDWAKSHGLQLIFLGSRGNKNTTDYVALEIEQLPGGQLLYLLQKSRGLILSFSDLSPLELHNFYSLSQKAQTPLLVRPQQMELFPGLVRQQKTGWILEKGEDSLRDLLLQNPQLRLPPWPEEISQMSLLDSTLNEMTRLYSRVLTDSV